ncbi:hypothetical protein D3C84_855640 [compost metagenome]
MRAIQIAHRHGTGQGWTEAAAADLANDTTGVIDNFRVLAHWRAFLWQQADPFAGDTAVLLSENLLGTGETAGAGAVRPTYFGNGP